MNRAEDRRQLDDELLEDVKGGLNWKAVGQAVKDKVNERGLDTDPRYKPIIDLIKNKQWTEFTERILPMLSENDPLIREALSEVKSQ